MKLEKKNYSAFYFCQMPFMSSAICSSYFLPLVTLSDSMLCLHVITCYFQLSSAVQVFFFFFFFWGGGGGGSLFTLSHVLSYDIILYFYSFSCLFQFFSWCLHRLSSAYIQVTCHFLSSAVCSSHFLVSSNTFLCAAIVAGPFSSFSM